MGRIPKISGAVREALGQCRAHFYAIGIISALINILYLAPSIYMLQVYDRVLPTGGLLTLFWLTLFTAFLLLVLAVFDAIRMRLLVKVGMRFEKILAPQLLERTVNQNNLAAVQKAGPQLMRDFDQLRGAVSGAPAVVLFDLPWTPIYVLVAALIHPLLALLIVIGGGVLIAVTIWNRRASKQQIAEADLEAKKAYALNDTIFGRAEVIHALGMQRAMLRRQLAARTPGLAMNAEVNIRSGHFIAAGRGLRMLLQTVALGAGALLVVDYRISAGSMIAVSILLTRALQPVEQLLGALSTIGQASEGYASITQVLATPATLDTERTALPAPQGHIALENVHVGDEGADEWILRGITLSLRPGRIIGIVGPSGSGKTTLARVLSGAIHPERGQVRIDNANITDWDAEYLGRHVGYLPQEVALFPGSVADNIARFSDRSGVDRKIVDEKIIKAARITGAHDMIMGLNGAYDRQIGRNGFGLSAGQRQLVGIARAFYGSPKILILDEPNSALDGDGEARLVQAMRMARDGGATVIIMAHRVNILSRADDILVLRQGKVQEYGPAGDILTKLSGDRPRSPALADGVPQAAQ